jgi:hypothetical protein
MSNSGPFLVTTGHSRLKNGVASLAYAPVVHAERPHGKPHRQSYFTFAWIAGQKGVHARLRRAMPGNDDVKKRSRGAFLRPSFAQPRHCEERERQSNPDF